MWLLVQYTLIQVTPYEFMQKWSSVPKSAGSGLHAALLKQISPKQLPTCKKFYFSVCGLKKIIILISLPPSPSVVKQTGWKHPS